MTESVCECVCECVCESTKDMIFSCAECVSWLSNNMTLMPGQVCECVCMSVCMCMGVCMSVCK